MLAPYINQEEFSAFSASREQLEQIIQGLSSAERSRAGEVANNRLDKFKGILQTDGYAGYQK